jgi:hypothetical protein
VVPFAPEDLRWQLSERTERRVAPIRKHRAPGCDRKDHQPCVIEAVRDILGATATETNRIQLFLFGLKIKTYGPYLATVNRILVVRCAARCAAFPSFRALESDRDRRR